MDNFQYACASPYQSLSKAATYDNQNKSKYRWKLELISLYKIILQRNKIHEYNLIIKNRINLSYLVEKFNGSIVYLIASML